MRNYEDVKRLVTREKTLKTYETWMEYLGILNIDNRVTVFEALLEENSIIVYDGLVYPLDNIQYSIGVFRAVRETFGFVDNENVSVYVGQGDSANALDLDMVLVEIKNNEKQFGIIRGVIKRGRDVLLGTMVQRGKKLSFEPYDSRINHKVTYEIGSFELNPNDRVVGKILSVDSKIHVEIQSVLGQADEPGMDVQSVLFVYGIDIEFKKEVLEEASKVPEIILESDLVGRVDHRDQYVITIDGEDAKDLDDAIYMESRANGYRLYVHIADVSHYVKPGTELWKSALDRSTSVYLVDRVVPMLPKNLSNGICSLHPKVDRLVLTIQMDLDFNGSVLDYHVYESVIQSKQRLSYNQVNRGEDLGQAHDMVMMMLECAKRLEYKREQAGSIGFDSDESKFLVDNEGRVLDIFRRETGEAERMIEMFMVSANEMVAQLTKYQFIPTLYRVHDHPTKEKMQELSHTLRILGYRMKGSLEEVHPKTLQKALEYFKDKPEYPVVSKLMLRSMSKAKYSQEPTGHFGLALEDYAHFTSPIRRFPDLLLHSRLKKYAFNHDFSELKHDEVLTIEAAEHTSRKERSVLDAERHVEKIKKAQFMQDKVGEIYIGYISGVSNYGIFVELPNTVEGLVHVRDLNDDYYVFDAPSQKMIGERKGKTYSIGQKVKVKLVSVDNVENVINFKFIESSSRSTKKRSQNYKSGKADLKVEVRKGVKNERRRKK